jgi:hypothetical protein
MAFSRPLPSAALEKSLSNPKPISNTEGRES